MSKHTSAPWGIGQNAMGHWMITAEESEHHRGYIATLATTNTQSETNARLIAAAPEMLEALEAVAPLLHWLDQEQNVTIAGDMLPKVLAAIAAAKGEDQ
jgi:hypothetical protein